MIPRNPLKLESCIFIDNFLPPRRLGSELISSSAASMAIFATLPLIELNVKIAPTFTVPPGLIAPSEKELVQRIQKDKSQARFMVMLKDESNHLASKT